MSWNILNGDNRTVLATFPDNHFDAIVTDPPYGIDFLGKAWDANVGAVETYQQCLRVLKPGGHILAFSAPRTYHHLAVTLEQAGFEIRDQIMWIYSSGFPKSQDIGRQIQKALHGKPDKQRFDPATMIQVEGDRYRHPDSGVIYRKLPDINGNRLALSHEGSGYGCVFEQVMERNIKTLPSTDTVTVEFRPKNVCEFCDKTNNGTNHKTCDRDPCGLKQMLAQAQNDWSGWGTCLKPAHEPICLARKPLSERNIRANCEQWGVGALNIDATRVPYADEADIETYLDNKRGPMERATIKDGQGIGMFEGQVGYKAIKREVDPEIDLPQGRFPANVIGEIAEPYQKYFYCPKVSKAERGSGNNHPTVKPIELMKYLIKLVTPAGGHVLDPFNGSGSTGCAAAELGYDYTGIELDPNYVAIARRRIEAREQQHKSGTTFEDLFE